MERAVRGKGKPVLYVLILLAAIGFNFVHLNLFLDSLPITFGGFFLYVILELLGFRHALPVALVLSLQTGLFYSDPFWAVFSLLEFLFVAALRVRLGFNLVVSMLIFWTLLGIPSYFLILNRIFGIEPLVAFTLPLKNAVNGLVNATLADLVAIIYSFYTKEWRKVSYRQVISLSLLVMATIPLLILAVYQAKQEEKEMVHSVKEDLELITENVKNNLTYWLDTHLNAVRELANRLVIWGKKNREQLQKETEAIRRAFQDLHACYIADENATTLTFYPEVNPKGRYMIGINFSYRPYYKRVKKTLKHTFTEVFVAKFALRPVVGIAVPAVKGDKFIGYAYCGLRLEHVNEIVKEASLKEGVFVTIVDSKGRVIVSGFKDLKPLSEFNVSEIEITEHGIPIVHRGGDEHVIGVGKYLHSYFYREERMREDIGWRVATFVSVRPYMDSLFGELSGIFFLIIFLSALSFLVAKILGGFISEPVERLARTVDSLTRTIERGPKVVLPKTNLLEISLLSESFGELAKKLSSYMEELKRLAYYDTLTGLPNRTLLRDRIEGAMARAHRNGTKVAVLFIDLDYFKTVNDTLGHEAGDRILVQVANRLSSAFREVDTVARFGGDEFVAVITDVKDIGSIVAVAEKVLKLFDTPFDADGEDVYLSASIGIALYPDNGDDPSTLIKNADMAMYKAKEEGKNNFAFFSEEMNRKAEEILTLKTKLHRALERKEFVLYYQPIYRASTGELVGLEALLRWNDPRTGLVQPHKFIPLLEELGFIKEVGGWVMEKAFSKSKEWEKYGVYVSVNVSPKQFIDRRFVDRVKEVLKGTEANPFSLVLEITETSLMYDPEESAKRLKRLKTLGFRLAVDDFGTGYSSLAYLKRLPIDIIKIDMTFTQNVNQSKVDRAIVSSIIMLANSLGLETLAEGVETKGQLEAMKEMGCDLVQGFYLGRPVPEEEAEQLIRKEKGL